MAPIDLNARLEKALRLAGNTHTLDDVLSALKDGRMHSMAHNNAFIILEIAQAPQCKYLNVFLAVSDDVKDVMAMQPRMLEFARSNGCKWVQTLGRRGWIDVLPDYGWKPTHTLFVLGLDDLGIDNGKTNAGPGAN